MPVGEFQYTLLVISGQSALVEENTALLLAQVAERNNAHEILPTGITLPGRVGWIATRQDGQNRIRELGKKGCAQPGVERCENLISVDKDHSPLRCGV